MKAHIYLMQVCTRIGSLSLISAACALMIIGISSCDDDEIITPPEAKFSYTSDNSMNAPSKLTFVNESSHAETYYWKFGDDTFSDVENPQHEYTTPGVYTVMLIASSAKGKDSVSHEIEILAPDAEAAFSFTSDNGFHTPTQITFTNESQHATEFQWNFGDETEMSSEENPVHTYTKSGTYTVTLTASSESMSVEKTATIEVTPFEPVADFTFADDGDLFIPVVVTFTNNSTHAATYEWDFGDGSDKKTDKNPIHTYTTPGDYTITLTATNETLTSTKTKNISIKAPAYTGLYILKSVILTKDLTIGRNIYPAGTDVTESVAEIFGLSGCSTNEQTKIQLKQSGDLYFNCENNESMVGTWVSHANDHTLKLTLFSPPLPQEMTVTLEDVDNTGNTLIGEVNDYELCLTPGCFDPITVSTEVTFQKL